MTEIITFDEALGDARQSTKKNLILGNGFSIACKPDIFRYGSLFEQADFSRMQEARRAFDVLQTQDFETVIKALEESSKIFPLYFDPKDTTLKKLRGHAEALKTLLVDTLAQNHPEFPGRISDERFFNCRKFLSNFSSSENDGRIYSLNYDLLLYWALMHEEVPEGEEPIRITSNDGFSSDENDPDADYVVWHGETSSNYQRVFYLHGALHLFDAGSDLKKYTWIRSGIPLIEQTRTAISEKMFPLFVAEGRSNQKLAKIKHSAYLYHCFKSLVSVANQRNGAFFVYGHSLSENDQHIFSRLGRGRFPTLYISLHGDPESYRNKAIIEKGEAIKAFRNERDPLTIKYYSAETANIWD